MERLDKILSKKSPELFKFIEENSIVFNKYFTSIKYSTKIANNALSTLK